LPEAASDALFKLKNDETLAEIAEAEKEVVPVIEDMLARKAEGKPLPPEEYDKMTRFVDRVEKRTIALKTPVVVEPVDDTLVAQIRATVSAGVYDQNILDSGLPEHVAYILQGAGLETTGALLEQIKRNSDRVLGLQGIGPKAMQEITKLVDMLLPAKEEVVEAPAVTEVEKPAEETIETAPVEPAPTEVEEPQPAEEIPAGPTEPELTFDELFKLETLKKEAAEEEEETAEGDVKDKKKKKVKSVVVEYDPDRDITIARKKHKRGDDIFSEDV
jgi:transcription termination/antitermination protein NusA